uniref:Uncharacterized protein n=1 Tax=Arundo donax TaxID=35708 RepID=A0A0A8Y5B4_ARUDO
MSSQVGGMPKQVGIFSAPSLEEQLPPTLPITRSHTKVSESQD